VFPLAPVPPLATLLRAQRAYTTQVERQRGCVIPHVFHRNGRPIKSYWEGWTNACRRACVPGRLVHDMRRTAVRRLERAGVPRSQAMALVGHKTQSIYQRYAVVCEQDLNAAAARLAAQLAADATGAATKSATGVLPVAPGPAAGDL